MNKKVEERPYRGELISFPGAWGFQIGRPHVILVSDEELEALADPGRKLNLSMTHERVEKSLREICEEAKGRGQRTLIVAFDHWWTDGRRCSRMRKWRRLRGRRWRRSGAWRAGLCGR